MITIFSVLITSYKEHVNYMKETFKQKFITYVINTYFPIAKKFSTIKLINNFVNKNNFFKKRRERKLYFTNLELIMH